MRLKEFLQDGGLVNNPTKVQSIINKYSSGKSPLTANDYIDVSKRTGVPIELLLAQGAVESNFGTQGRAVRTRNVGNVGNTDLGAAEYKNSWKDGLLRQANLLKNEYKVSSQADISRLIGNRFERPAGGNYATAPNYSQQIASVLNTFSNQKYTPQQISANQNNDPSLQAEPLTPQIDIQPLKLVDTRQFFLDNRGAVNSLSQETQKQFEESLRLENEKLSQEQNAKQAELRNQEIQAELAQKNAERNQLISMIPQAQFVGSQPQQFQKGGVTDISAESDWLKNWYTNRKIPDAQFNSDLSEDRNLILERFNNPIVTQKEFIEPNVEGRYIHGEGIYLTPRSDSTDKLHELDHYVTDQALYTNTNDTQVIRDNIKSKDASKGIYNEKYDYFSNPQEIKARIMILRREMGLDPSKPVNKQDVDKFIRGYNGKESNIYDLMHMTDSPENIYNILNWTANNTNNKVQNKLI